MPTLLKKKTSSQPGGYALLLGTILLVVMITIGLAVSSLLIRELQLSERVVFEAQAIAAADAGTERALYQDFRIDQPSNISPPPDISSASAPIYSATYYIHVCTNDSTRFCKVDADCVSSTCNTGATSPATELKVSGTSNGSVRQFQLVY